MILIQKNKKTKSVSNYIPIITKENHSLWQLGMVDHAVAWLRNLKTIWDD